MGRYASYVVRLAPTSLSAGKTLIQIKAGGAGLELLGARLRQFTKTTTEFWDVTILRKTAAATVTSFTPLKLDPNDPVSLAVGGTAATGTNASAEGTDGDILSELGWNLLNGEDADVPVPDGRIWVPPAGIIAVKLNTTPAQATSCGVIAWYSEYQ